MLRQREENPSGAEQRRNRATTRAATLAPAVALAAAAIWWGAVRPVIAQQVEAPTTAPAPAPAPATRPSTNGAEKNITTQPGGKFLLNFRDANVDTVLDELSSAAG